MSRSFYAHSLPDTPIEHWQPLEKHLRNVAEMAGEFARSFSGDQWAYLVGLWHDLGKCSREFQEKILNQSQKRVDHSTAGGRHAVNLWKDVGKMLAYAIIGHHGGLPDGKNSSGVDLTTSLDSQKKKVPAILDDCLDVPEPSEKPSLPVHLEEGRVGFQLAFFVRMIYSCLVDADFLDTEQFLDPERAKLRQDRPTLADLKQPLFFRLRQFCADSEINQKRARILQECIQAAPKAPGLFTLTVPTGGGKTLSSLAFAVRHGLMHGMERVIYVIPFTSIIEQNAGIFRSILGDEAVLEHHSMFEPKATSEDKQDDSIQAKRHRMACENWDAPLIVTTNVQFFESFFANRSSRCRKLHNIANSVIILDEAQMLPERYLRPCLETIRELAANYGCTIVLCTATQPALTKSSAFPFGLPEARVTEIMEDPQALHAAFKRVQLKTVGPVSDTRIAEHILKRKQVLCIVNTRRHAHELFNGIRDLPGAFHLSARMCPAHRSEVLDRIRRSLKTDQPCRVVATQLVEAGVDLDFPAVFREMAGLDSIAQAAGRCNRNAEMKSGEVFVFQPEDGRIPRLFRRAAGAADSVLRRFEDPFEPKAINEYFTQAYWLAGDELDKKEIMTDLESGVVQGDFPFRQVAKRFHLIESEMIPVIVPWDRRAEKLLKSLEYAEFPGSFLRGLQPYTVQIYSHEFAQLKTSGGIKMIQDTYAALVSLAPFYRPDVGLNISGEIQSPEELIF